jgi:FkbM family methyltransferase
MDGPAPRTDCRRANGDPKLKHPDIVSRAVRSLRFMRNMRGWPTIAQRLARRSGSFEVSNGPVRMAGDMASLVDRSVYLFGGYEKDLIRLFLDAVPRYKIVLDVGANVGTHSMMFAQRFEKVLAFEPNPAIWPSFEANAALNPEANVILHRIGLSDESGEFQLYNVDIGNLGLATFLRDEQYDQPLKPFATARTERADDILADVNADAIKIDVQGAEVRVLRGMQALLARSRPVTWLELGAGTQSEGLRRRDQVEALFPYPIRLSKFVARPRLLHRSIALMPYEADELEVGDYLAFPRD